MFTNSVLTWHDFTRIIALLSMINGKFIIKISQNKIVKSIFFWTNPKYRKLFD